LRNNSVQRKKESLALKRRELELREKELELKTKFLNAETQVMNDKHTDKAEHEKKLERIKLERELRALEHNYRTKEDLTRMNEIRVALGIRLANPQVAQEPQQQPHP
jgi:hypothetical protein